MRAPARPTGTCRQNPTGTSNRTYVSKILVSLQSVCTVKTHSSTKKIYFSFLLRIRCASDNTTLRVFGLLGVSVYVCVDERIVRRVETGNFVLFAARTKSLGTLNRSPSACASQTHRETACAITCSGTHTYKHGKIRCTIEWNEFPLPWGKQQHLTNTSPQTVLHFMFVVFFVCRRRRVVATINICFDCHEYRTREAERKWAKENSRILCLRNVMVVPLMVCAMFVYVCVRACLRVEQNFRGANMRSTACIKFSVIYWIYWIVWRLNQETESRTIFHYFQFLPSHFSTFFRKR